MRKKISPIGTDWDDFKQTLLTPEERAESGKRVAAISALIQARGTNRTAPSRYVGATAP